MTKSAPEWILCLCNVASSWKSISEEACRSFLVGVSQKIMKTATYGIVVHIHNRVRKIESRYCNVRYLFEQLP